VPAAAWSCEPGDSDHDPIEYPIGAGHSALNARLPTHWVGYFNEVAPGAHAPNSPSRYGVVASDISSVKRGYQNGYVQLTVVESRAIPGTYLLDCDTDEDRQILAHGLDCLTHSFNGGMHLSTCTNTLFTTPHK